MTKLLKREELEEMEVRIYQTYGMEKFSPKDVMDLIYTAQRYMELSKNFEVSYETLKKLLKIKPPK